MSHPIEPEAPRLEELDGVRGLAALLVVYTHIFLTWVPAPNKVVFWIRTMSGMAWTGVVLFFVLSGFLIGGNLLRHRNAKNYFQVFYTRRALRIFPLYYFLLAVYLVIRVGTTIGKTSPEFTPHVVPAWSYAVMVQNFFMAFTGDWGVGALSVTWSVALEEQFYLFLPLLIRFVPVRGIFPLLCVMVAAGPLFRHTINDSLFLLTGSAESLFGGVLLAWVYRNHPQVFSEKKWVWIARALFVGAAGGMALVAANWNFGVFRSSIITAFWCTFLWLVLAARQTPWTAIFRAAWLRGIGRISYGVYLFHGLSAHLVVIVLGHSEHASELGAYGLFLSVLSVAVTLGFAWLSFNFVERRLIKIGQRHVYVS